MSLRLLAVWTCALLLVGNGFAGDTAGIGIAVGAKGDTVFVAQILPGTPAAASHTLKVRDRIIAIGQGEAPPVHITGTNLPQVLKMIRGTAGTVVRLTIIPEGTEPSQARILSFVRTNLKMLMDGEVLPNGTQAPNVRFLRLSDHRDEHLADYRGKLVVLEFWASWCGPCQQAMQELQALVSKHPDWSGKVAWIAADIEEERDRAVQWLELKNCHQTHNVWVAPDVVRAFHLTAIPTLYVLDAQGKVVAAGHVDVSAILTKLLR